MTRTLIVFCLLLFIPPLPTGFAQAPPASAGPTFDSFRIVLDRNIFNPNRTVQSEAVAPPPVITPVPMDRVSLLGTLISGRRRIAFVEGSSAPPDGQIGAGDMVGDWEVDSIDTDGVVLTKDNGRIVWPVHYQIERQPGQNWRVAEIAYTNPAGGGRGGDRSGDRGAGRSGFNQGGRGGFNPAGSTPIGLNQGGFNQGGFNQGNRNNFDQGGRTGRTGRTGRGGRSFGGDSGAVAAPAADDDWLGLGTPATPAAAAPDVSQDDLVKQLMERRQKETKGE